MRQVAKREVEDSYDLLTPREKEILQLVAEGKTNKEVATFSSSASTRWKAIEAIFSKS